MDGSVYTAYTSLYPQDGDQAGAIMRTWKQGAIGKITFPDSNYVYLKCLKYPLALFYKEYEYDTQILKSEVFYAYLHLSTLSHIDRIHVIKLTAADLETGETRIDSANPVPDLFKKMKSSNLATMDDLHSLIH